MWYTCRVLSSASPCSDTAAAVAPLACDNLDRFREVYANFVRILQPVEVEVEVEMRKWKSCWRRSLSASLLPVPVRPLAKTSGSNVLRERRRYI